MKKNRLFIFITALLLTLLMVVGCDVSPAPMNNGLVRASISVSNSRDLQVVGGDGNIDYYKIAMIPEWSTSNLSESIVGKKGNRDESGVVTEWIDVTPLEEHGNLFIDLGYVSQGKWTIYLNGYNKDGVLIYTGNTSTYLKKDNSNIVIFLNRYSDAQKNGHIGFFIVVNQLKILESDHKSSYGLKYDVRSLDGNTVLNEDVNKYLEVSSFVENKVNYGLWDDKVSFIPDDYYVTVSLVINPKTENERVIGGITRLVSIYPGITSDTHTWTMIRGEVAPSDFLQVGIDFPVPEITTIMDASEQGGVYTFTCTDTYNNTDKFNRYYRWFIDGELVKDNSDYSKWSVASISSSTLEPNKSTMTCSFNKKGLGEREIRCEVVYVPIDIDGVDEKPLHFVGGSTSYVQVLSVNS